MSDRDLRRMDGDRNHKADIGRVAIAVGQFAGAVFDEFQDRRQPCQQPGGDMNHRPNIRRVASAAGHFDGTVTDEFNDRRQPNQQPRGRGASNKVGARYDPRNNPVIRERGASSTVGARNDPRNNPVIRDRGASSTVGARNDPRNNPVIPVPFVRKTGLLRQNKIIFICGVPYPNARRFTVTLQQDDGNEPHLIALCVGARFVFGADRNIVVRNHKDGGWGREERDLSYFPFREDREFEMIILVERNCFKVAVNNRHMLEFKHRIRALDRIDTLRITGDVTLTQVRIQD